MIFPDKFTPVESSIIGISAAILQIIDAPMSQSSLWGKFQSTRSDETYQRFVTALDLLFSVKAIHASYNPFKIEKIT
jgi:hypothetical protein